MHLTVGKGNVLLGGLVFDIPNIEVSIHIPQNNVVPLPRNAGHASHCLLQQQLYCDLKYKTKYIDQMVNLPKYDYIYDFGGGGILMN